MLWCIVRRQRGNASKSNPTNGTNCVCKLELRFLGVKFKFAKSAVVKLLSSEPNLALTEIWSGTNNVHAATRWAALFYKLFCHIRIFLNQ